jgi:phosphoglycerol transferase MdoB-like AlkP superfamily enzyme
MIAQHVFQVLAIIALVVLVPLLYVRWRAKNGVLNAKQWTWLAVLILLAGLLGRIPAITLLAALALLALGIGWLWHKAILANVRYTCDLR